MLKAQPKTKPLTAPQWEAKFRAAIDADYETHDDPIIKTLCAACDNTMLHVADHVRRYVCDYWRAANEDRRLRGAEMRKVLATAIAGQLTTIKALEAALAQIDKAELGAHEPDRINAQSGLQMARELLTRLEAMQERAPDAFNTKSPGDAGDLQTLLSLDCFLRYRLGESSFDTIATLIDCGYAAEGLARDAFGSGENLKKRLETFRENHAQLAQHTEAAVQLISRR